MNPRPSVINAPICTHHVNAPSKPFHRRTQSSCFLGRFVSNQTQFAIVCVFVVVVVVVLILSAYKIRARDPSSVSGCASKTPQREMMRCARVSNKYMRLGPMVCNVFTRCCNDAVSVLPACLLPLCCRVDRRCCCVHIRKHHARRTAVSLMIVISLPLNWLLICSLVVNSSVPLAQRARARERSCCVNGVLSLCVGM